MLFLPKRDILYYLNRLYYFIERSSEICTRKKAYLKLFKVSFQKDIYIYTYILVFKQIVIHSEQISIKFLV